MIRAIICILCLTSCYAIEDFFPVGEETALNNVTFVPTFIPSLFTFPADNDNGTKPNSEPEVSTPPGNRTNRKSKKLYLMAFSSININANGWSSGGVVPAIEMGIEDINNRDDVLPGYELAMDLKDSQCNPGKAIQGFYEHISQPPTKIMILGGGCSVATVPVARTAPYFGLVQMGYSAASPELHQRDIFPTFFRTAMSDLAMPPPIISLMDHYQWRHIATIHEQNEMFAMTVNQLHFLLSQTNYTLVTAESFQVSPAANVANILRKDARIIFFNGYEGSARSVFCQAYLQKAYGAKYQWIMPGWYNADWADVNDTICSPEEVRTAALYAIALTDLKGDLSGQKTISGMTYDDYVTRYKSWPSIAEYGENGYHPNGYDAIWAISLAFDKAAEVIALNNVTEIINGTNVTRSMRLDDFAYGESPEITQAIFDAISDVQFHGVSGEVAFNLGERSAIVDVTQIQEDGTVRAAVYTETTGQLEFVSDDIIKWHGRGPPKSALEPALVLTHKNKVLVICCCTLAGIGAVVAVLFLIFNIINSDHAHIKMSSPRLNNMIVFGTILAFLCVILLGMDLQFVSEKQLENLCTVRKWLIAAAFTFSFGAMFAKTWRVHVIFTRKFSLANKPVHDIHLIGFVGVLLVVDVVLMTAWTVIDPFDLLYKNISTEDVDDYRYIYQMAACQCDHSWYWTGALYLYKGLLLVFGCFLAWEIRNVSIPGFNDSKYIGVCVYNVVIMCLVGVTVSMAIPDMQDISYAFQAFCILFCAYTSLIVLFVPKIRHVIKHPEESAKNRKSTKYNGKAPSSTFNYTVKDMKKKDTVRTISADDSTQVVDQNDISAHNYEHLVKDLKLKNKEVEELKARIAILEQTIHDLMLQKNTEDVKASTNGITLQPYDLESNNAEVRRAASDSSPRRKRDGNGGPNESSTDEGGFDNVGYC